MKNKKKKDHMFGLFTSVCLIIGVVVGSGIFFKSDKVLQYTGGNVELGVLVFVFAAIAIIFGSLSMSELAIRSDKAGGVIDYAQTYLNTKFACVFGWFQNFVYYPAINAVISWVSVTYICILFNLKISLELEIMISLFIVTGIFLLQYISTKLVGQFQNITTVVKLIPIVLVIIYGWFKGNPNLLVEPISGSHSSASWVSAIGPIAFAYDGWIVATGISHEIRNSKRNLPLALIIAPIFILCAYVSYFVGMCMLIGPEKIMELRESHAYLAAGIMFGKAGSKIFIIFIIVSIIGTINGVSLGNSRGIYALGVHNMMPKAKRMTKMNKTFKTPSKSILFCYIITLFWLVIHYLTTKNGVLQNSDISEIAVVTTYLLYILLYVQVIRLKKRGEITSCMRGYIIPLLAILGSIFIFIGGIQSAMFWYYVSFSVAVMIIAYLYACKYMKEEK